MNVLVVSDYYLPHWTGISKSLQSIIHTIKKKHAVSVLTTQFQINLPQQEIIDGTIITRVPYLLSISRAKFSPLLFFQAVSHIQKADAVLINSPSIHIFPLSLVVKLLGKKLFIFHQGDLSLPRSTLNKFIEKVFDLFSFISFSLADKIATYTQDYAKHSRVLKPHLKKCTSFIPVALPIKSAAHQVIISLLKSFRKKYAFIFGFAGRFVEEKGFDLLLQAIPQVMRSIPNVHFLYAGKTNMGYENFYLQVSDLYKKVKNNITELGLLNDADLHHFYRTIDCIIIPSRSDCFNLVQMEAMMQRAPSVVSDIPGARFLVSLSGFGKLYSPNTSESLAKALIDIYHAQDTIQKQYHSLLPLLNKKKNEELIDKFIAS